MAIIVHTEHQCGNLLLEVQPEQRLVRSTWSGVLVGDQYRRLLQQVIAVVERKELRYWLTDARRAGPIAEEDQAWTMQEFTPQVIRAGIERIAIVGSEDLGHQAAVQRFVAATPQDVPYSLGFFDDPAIATLWLLERRPARDTFGGDHAALPGEQADDR